MIFLQQDLFFYNDLYFLQQLQIVEHKLLVKYLETRPNILVTTIFFTTIKYFLQRQLC